MTDAVILSRCGHSGCGSCFLNLARREPDADDPTPPTCPMCRRPIWGQELTPNFALRHLIDEVSFFTLN